MGQVLGTYLTRRGREGAALDLAEYLPRGEHCDEIGESGDGSWAGLGRDMGEVM